MSEATDQPQTEGQPQQQAEKTGYTGHEYPWMTDSKAYKANHSLRHLPPMLRRKQGGKAR